jgi:hypothetical protein
MPPSLPAVPVGDEPAKLPGGAQAWLDAVAQGLTASKRLPQHRVRREMELWTCELSRVTAQRRLKKRTGSASAYRQHNHGGNPQHGPPTEPFQDSLSEYGAPESGLVRRMTYAIRSLESAPKAGRGG